MKDKVFGKLGGLNLPVVIGGLVTLGVVILLAALIVNALTKPKSNKDEIAEGPIPSVSAVPTVTPAPEANKSVQGVKSQIIKPTDKPATVNTQTAPAAPVATVRTVTTEDVIVKLNPRCTKMRARWNPEDPYQVSFTTEGQADGATVVNYQWDFDGNGSWDSEEGRVENSIGHRYSEKKSYTVKTRVRDSQGRWSETCEIGIDLNSN